MGVRLGPSLKAYYAALERLRPGTVHRLEAAGDARAAAMVVLRRLAPHQYERYDTTVLDRLKRDLDRLLAATTETR
ncbi:MAG: hypothetical protein M3Q65_04955 [Chloroflexota bacterium]|nr:hypothetical protein [Chloroflexota bacterium]